MFRGLGENLADRQLEIDKMDLKRGAAVAGSLAILAGFSLAHLVKVAPKGLTVKPAGEVRITAGTVYPESCPSCGFVEELAIRYPERMRVNDSSDVEVILGPEGLGSYYTLEEDEGDLFRLSESLELSLVGAAFDVSPSVRIQKPEGSLLPVSWRWSIAPRREGNQSLLLDLESLELWTFGAPLEHGEEAVLIVEVNGVEMRGVSFSDLRSQVLPITVLTREGVSLTTFLFARYSLLLAGFILMYPAVSGAIGVRFSRKRNSSQTGGAEGPPVRRQPEGVSVETKESPE